MSNKLTGLRRREFLRMVALGGIAFAVPLLGLQLASTVSLIRSQAQSFEASFNALGTTIAIRIEEDLSSTFANLAVASASNEINRLETLLASFPRGTDVWDCLFYSRSNVILTSGMKQLMT